MPVRSIDHVRGGRPSVEDEPLDGYYRVYAHDPFGNRLELLEPSTG